MPGMTKAEVTPRSCGFNRSTSSSGSARKAMTAPTTYAETKKLAGVLVGYNAELSTEIDNAAAQVATQEAKPRGL